MYIIKDGDLQSHHTALVQLSEFFVEIILQFLKFNLNIAPYLAIQIIVLIIFLLIILL